MNVSDFVPGSTVKVVGPFGRHDRYLDKYIGWYGRVLTNKGYAPKFVVVAFSPSDLFGELFPPKTLEQGRIEWVPVKMSDQDRSLEAFCSALRDATETDDFGPVWYQRGGDWAAAMPAWTLLVAVRDGVARPYRFEGNLIEGRAAIQVALDWEESLAAEVTT